MSELAGDLLEEIADHGWSESRCIRFELAYEGQIRQELAAALRQIGLSASRSRLGGLENRLTDRRMELLLDTRSDLWIELLDGLVGRFVDARASGRVSVPFPAYVRGVIRHLMIRNARSLGLLPGESEAEMLRSLARARSEKTAEQWIARLKVVFWQRVVDHVLNGCPTDSFVLVYRNIAHIVDYFFEIYVPERVATSPRRTLSELVENYMSGSYVTGISYIGHVAPFDPALRCRICGGFHSLVGDDEFLSRLSVVKGGHNAAW